MATLNSTGAASKVRVKEGDDLIPKTSFKPLAAPGKLNAFKYDADYLYEHMRLVYEDIMRIFVASKVPIFLWGPMGSGKTRGIEAMSEETDENGVNYQVITVQPSTEDASTFNGLMTITEDPRSGEKIMERSIPQVAEMVWKAFNDKDKLTIMFLDEMTTCIPAQQNAMLGLLTHGKYGTKDISPYVTFALAANPPGTVSTVLPLSEAVINRGGHIPWYSDGQHWYDKWTTGFGNPAKKPKKRTQDFIKMLIQQDPDIAFRDDPDHHEDADEGWSVDDLCPYDQMHFSERAVTEFAKVYEIIQDTLNTAPFDVKKLYLMETACAMLGKRWKEHSGIVEDALESRLTTKPIIDAINNNNITNNSTLEEIERAVGDRLHRNKGKRMRAEQEKEIADLFYEELFEGTFAAKRYLAFWVWLSTSPDEATRAPVIPVAINILQKSTSDEYRSDIPKSQLFPSFVPQQIKKEMTELRNISRHRND